MRWLIALVFCFLGTTVSADDIEFQLTCKVTHQSVTTLNEGKTTIYSGVKGSFETGEDLHFDISLEPNDAIWSELEDKKREKTLVNFFANQNQVRFIKSEDGETLTAGKDLNDHNSAAFLEISADQIFFERKYGRSFDTVGFHRYYKSDYQGIYTYYNSDAPYTHVVGMDCRTTKGSVDKVLAKFK